MINPQIDSVDNIPVLSDVVIPGALRTAPAAVSDSIPEAADDPLTQRLKSQAYILLACIQQRIEHMVQACLTTRCV